MNNQKINSHSDLETLSKLMPGVFFWKKDSDSTYMEVNKDCAELFGINSKREISGFTDYDIPCKISEFAVTFQQQDKQVIETGNSLKILEVHTCSKNQLRIMLNTKNPLRDKSNNIIGTFAYCIDITKQLGEINNLLSNINHTSTRKKSISGSFTFHQESDLFLTKREMDCLFYLLRGKSCKQIAAILQISPRTAEQYIEQLKNKFLCETKSDLIEAALNQGFINMIPASLLNQYFSKILLNN